MQGECCADTPAQDVMDGRGGFAQGVQLKLSPTSYYDYF
jgi:hypothetical protein